MVDILQAGLGQPGNVLRALGFDTLEQVIGAAAIAGPELSRVLGGDIGGILAPAMAIAQTISQTLRDELDQLPCALGANFETRTVVPDLPVALARAPQPVTANLSFAGQMPPIRNQGQRGTCVAFASLAAYEHYLILLNARRDMSAQFLYCDCKANDGIPN